MSRIRNRERRKVGEEGFTLLELILVMAIIGILAGLAVPRFGGVLGPAKEKADAANKQIIREAAELWYMETEQSGEKGGDSGEELDNATFGTDEGKKLIPDYLQEVPKNPMGKGEYKLKIDAEGRAEVTHAGDTKG